VVKKQSVKKQSVKKRSVKKRSVAGPADEVRALEVGREGAKAAWPMPGNSNSYQHRCGNAAKRVVAGGFGGVVERPTGSRGTGGG